MKLKYFTVDTVSVSQLITVNH